MTMFQIDDVRSYSKSFKAHMITVGTDPDGKYSFTDYDILAPDCDEIDNRCIKNVQEHGRDFFMSETQPGQIKMQTAYLALVNNEVNQTAMFSGSFQRVPS